MLKNKFFWLVALVGLLLDQISKLLIIKNFPQGTFPLLPGIFHLTYTVNTGAAWSVFQGGVNWLKWLSFLVSLGLMLFAYFGNKLKIIEQIGYGLILSGAMGNGLDRFIQGYVIDFLDFRLIHFPIFNIADICINLCIICLLWATVIEQPDRRNLHKK